MVCFYETGLSCVVSERTWGLVAWILLMSGDELIRLFGKTRGELFRIFGKLE